MGEIVHFSPAMAGCHSRGLWGLWDMLILDAHAFIAVLNKLTYLHYRGKDLQGRVSEGDLGNIKAGIEEVAQMMRVIEAPTSLTLLNNTVTTAKTHQELNAAVTALANTFAAELSGRKFYGPLRRYEQYYEQPKLFGDAVFAAFPSANNDIFEAGTCLALERGTACVMHLMRVVEVGLKTLAGILNISKQNDWGSYLREIDRVLVDRQKAAGKHSDDEQFYAEARVMLDGVRIAWRNPTMHIENNYPSERAEEILIAVRSLMRHLSQRVAEFLA